MTRLQGWGLLLAIAVPLLILFGWSRLGSETSRIQLDRFDRWSSTHVTPKLLYPLSQHFRKHKTLAVPDDFALPPVPKDSGIKAWSLQPDTVLRIELDSKENGRPMVLNYVPVLKSANGVFYDCVTDHSQLLVGHFCRSEWLRSEAEIPAQLEANARFLQNLPTASTEAGASLHAGAIGSVVAVPANVGDLERCGNDCVKLQSCVTPRPLACARQVRDGNTTYMEVAATPEDFRGSSFGNRNDADRVCAQSHGEGWLVLVAGSVSGVGKLSGGNEYWVHDEYRAENNCWR